MTAQLNGKPIQVCTLDPVQVIWRPGGLGCVEITGIDACTAGLVMRGILNAGDKWYSLKPVAVGGRYGFDGLDLLPKLPEGTLYVQLCDGQTAMWHTPPNLSDNKDIVCSYAGAMIYNGPIPLMLPDFSRVPWSLQGRELLGYGMTNWMHVPNKRDFIRQMRDCIGNVPGRRVTFYADLFGSTATQTSNDPGYWMRHPEGVKDALVALACACWEVDVLLYLAIWSGNYKGPNGTGICDPYFAPSLYRSILTVIREFIGPANVLICPAGEPWHPDAAACQDVMAEIHAITFAEWPGWKIANRITPTTGFIWEQHTAPGQYGPPDTLDLTDQPAKLDWLTCGNVSNGISPDRAGVLVGSDKDHGNGTIIYDMDTRAWAKDQSAVWRAIGEAARA